MINDNTTLLLMTALINLYMLSPKFKDLKEIETQLEKVKAKVSKSKLLIKSKPTMIMTLATQIVNTLLKNWG